MSVVVVKVLSIRWNWVVTKTLFTISSS